MNSINIMGRLTRDPEMTVVGNGQEKCRFSVAVERRRQKDKETQVDFFDCAAWAGTGAFINQWFHKGDGIAIKGRMESFKTEKDGRNVVFWTLNVEEVEFPPAKKSGGQNAASTPEEAAPTDPATGFTAVSTEELPF